MTPLRQVVLSPQAPHIHHRPNQGTHSAAHPGPGVPICWRDM